MADILSRFHIASASDSAGPYKDGESVLIVPQIRIESEEDSCRRMSPSSQACRAATNSRYCDFPSTSFPNNSKDTSSSKKKRNKKNRRKVQDMIASVPVEGQRGEEASNITVAVSSKLRLRECSRAQESLATATQTDDAMERADIGTYSSDEWEEDSVTSDTEVDHTDSSDDDDPKSQVDRLIEEGTLLYIEGENSALSSEDESDSSDYDSDSESDITDVSPLVSATASPLGLSPVLPRRTIPTSPLALHDNRDLEFDFFRQTLSNRDHSDHVESSNKPFEPCDHTDSTNMDLLMQAVLELQDRNLRKRHCGRSKNSENTDNNVFIHPIRDNPHHHHLRKNGSRKNMSFSNEEVRKIDRDNRILLKKIMAVHTRTKSSLHPHTTNHNHSLVHHKFHYNLSAPRKREEERVRRANLIILRKIQEAKPSKEVLVTRNHSGSSFSQG